jgi:hypothetical protein
MNCNSLEALPLPQQKITWQTKAPLKCRFFVWLMLQNRVWMAARL